MFGLSPLELAQQKAMQGQGGIGGPAPVVSAPAPAPRPPVAAASPTALNIEEVAIETTGLAGPEKPAGPSNSASEAAGNPIEWQNAKAKDMVELIRDELGLGAELTMTQVLDE